MTAQKFQSLPLKEKKKIIKSAIRAANKDQRELMKAYKVSRDAGKK